MVELLTKYDIFNLRLAKKPVPRDYDDLYIQCCAWEGKDIDTAEIEGENNPYEEFAEHVIKCFGVDSIGRTVSVSIKNFSPYFFVRAQKKCTKTGKWIDFNEKMDQVYFRNWVLSQLHKKSVNMLKDIRVVKRKDFWGFTNFQDFKFLCLMFKTDRSRKRIVSRIKECDKIPNIGDVKLVLYESNIDPFIRFLHLNDIEPTAWIKIPKGTYRKTTERLPTNCDIDIEVPFKYVKKHECMESAPFCIASTDIECYGLEGFPLAQKDFKLFAVKLYDAVTKTFKQEWIPARKSKHINNFLLYGLNLLTEEEEAKIFEENADEFDYRMHVSKLKFKKPFTNAERKHFRNLILAWGEDARHLLYGTSPRLHQYKSTKDYDKLKHNYIIQLLADDLNEMGLPGIEGDEVIQIGTTYHFYGERECHHRHILTLGETEPFEGTTVEYFQRESDMLMRWRELIATTNPDVITGYNIFGFDFNYLYLRAQELNILDEFSQLGRYKDVSCRFVEQPLCSSGLGENMLTYFDMNGRVLIDMMKVIQRDYKLDSVSLNNVAKVFMGLKKNDLDPQDIFRLHKGSAADRRMVAEYCIKDCELCNKLVIKLEVMANNIAMSNVCLVPFSFIFLRGQGIKIFSLMLKECRENGYLIPVIEKKEATMTDDMMLENPEDQESFEGAIVLDPEEGIYIEDPVSVMDYSSLYPSSIISENLSHDCLVIDKAYDNLEGVEYLDISYDRYEGKGDKKHKAGISTSRFVQLPNGEKGIVPRILMKLLAARKAMRKRIESKCVTMKDGRVLKGLLDEKKGVIAVPKGVMLMSDREDVSIDMSDVEKIEDEYNEFQKAVLDGLQLAYKVTANSLYGQMGAPTSKVFLKDIAACTTATGRNMILKAKDFLEKNYNARIVYGDTDSVFAIFPNKDEKGNRLIGQPAIKASINTAIAASAEFKKTIKKPHDLEYEKTFWPFILLSKKRYIGNLYEMDDKKFKEKGMGIVLKRRDNAQIVKTIYGGIINIILNKQDVQHSITFLKEKLDALVKGDFPLEELVVTKALKSMYKDPLRIAHKVLADRIAERDPGNKPQSNDRIPYAYILKPNAKLQGERIETPDFIVKNKLKIDYAHYLTNQIMNPVIQLYGIIAEQIPNNPHDADYYKKVWEKLETESMFKDNPKRMKEELTKIREKDVKALLFDPYIEHQKFLESNNTTITDFFKPTPKKAGPLVRKEPKEPKMLIEKEVKTEKTNTQKKAVKTKTLIDFTKKTNEVKVEEVANNVNTENTDNTVNNMKKTNETKKGRAKKEFKTLDEELAALEELERNSPAVEIDDRQRVKELRRQNVPWIKIAEMLSTNVYQVKKLVKQ